MLLIGEGAIPPRIFLSGDRSRELNIILSAKGEQT